MGFNKRVFCVGLAFLLIGVIFSLTAVPSALAQLCDPAPPSAFPNLVSWWRAENNFLDSFDGNHGSQQGGVSFVSGKVGQAFSLDGTDDFVNIPASPSLDGITTAVTVAAWINPQTPSSSSNGGAILAGYTVSVLPDGSLRLTVRKNGDPNVGGTVYVSSPGVILYDNQWKHVAVSLNVAGNVVSAYVNGSPVSFTKSSGLDLSGQLIPLSGVPVAIGRREQGSSPTDPQRAYFKGLMDEVALFSRALTSAEIQLQAGAFTQVKKMILAK